MEIIQGKSKSDTGVSVQYRGVNKKKKNMGEERGTGQQHGRDLEADPGVKEAEWASISSPP